MIDAEEALSRELETALAETASQESSAEREARSSRKAVDKEARRREGLVLDKWFKSWKRIPTTKEKAEGRQEG